MLRHVVLLELRAGAPAGRAEAIAAALRALPGVIPGIISYEVSVDLGLSGGGNAHLGVVATFEDEAAWRGYGPHPEHQAVVTELVAPVLRRRLALQADLTDR